MFAVNGTNDIDLRAVNAVIALLSLLFIFPALFWVPSGAYAHEIWLERTDLRLVLLSGHTGTTHGEREINEYAPEEVLRVECFNRSGNGGEITFERVYPITLPDSCAVIYVLTSSGYWTKTPFGTKRVPRNEARAPLESWLSYESVKRIDNWGEELAGPLTGDLELCPAENPLKLREGRKARLLATIGGEPTAGIPVAYDGKTRGMTDSHGRVNIKIRHGGLQMIQASYAEPGDSVKTDRIVHTTTLIFEIPVENRE